MMSGMNFVVVAGWGKIASGYHGSSPAMPNAATGWDEKNPDELLTDLEAVKANRSVMPDTGLRSADTSARIRGFRQRCGFVEPIRFAP
jgi:hypothetical protein